MTKNDIYLVKKALFAVAMQEVKFMDSLPEVDLPRSQRYVENMASIKCQAKAAKRKKSLTKKIIIAIIAATLLLITACAVSKPIMDFFITVYNDHTNFYSNDGGTGTIETVYMPSYLPKGYEITSEFVGEMGVQVVWSNSESQTLVYKQSLTKNSNLSLNTENSDYTVWYVKEQPIFYISKYNYYSFVWKKDDYLFELQCHDSIPREEIEEIISSICEQPQLDSAT